MRLKPKVTPLRIGAASGPTLRCSIYCRVSADDVRDSKNKSVEHQREQATAYIKKKGWSVSHEYVFKDDGISGAEYVNRPGLAQLLACLPKRGKPPFDVLVMSEPSRLGRDITRNAAFVVSILESGVRIFYYLTDEEEKADTPEQQIVLTLRGYASAVERLKAGQRTRTVLESRAKNGYVTGGRCFGYDNVEVHGVNGAGEQVRSHVDHKINEQEAEVVRRIFTCYRDGWGMCAIAKCLNGDPRFRKQQRKYFKGKTRPGPRTGTGSWAPSSIRAMLYSPRYAGKVPYGRMRRVYKGGTQKREVAGKPMLADRPDLRIVPEPLWNAVQARLKAVKENYIREQSGQLWGRPETNRASNYLLSGIARCGLCGASMVATKGLGAGRKLHARYACSYNSNRGKTVCANNWRESQEVLDRKVIGAIERSILTPDAISYVVDRALQMAKERRKQEPDTSKKLEAEIKRLTRERDNLISDSAQGKAPASLLAAIHEREQGIEALKDELARSPHRLQVKDGELERLKAAIIGRMGKFQELMHADVPLARQGLRKLLGGPIKCTPVIRDGKRDYAIRGEAKLENLLPGASVRLVPRKGLEPPQCCHR